MNNGLVVWFTGLSGAGKSTLALRLKDILVSMDKTVILLDGDDVRTYLTSDLGFSKEDRDENIKRIGYVAKVVADCGAIAIVAAISPYKEARQQAKELIGADRFVQVYVECPISQLVKRDVKGLYQKAIEGEVKNFTGISDPYEHPETSDCTVHTSATSIERCMDILMKHLIDKI